MSTKEVADEVSASQGLPSTETSSVQMTEEMAVLISNEANINIPPAEVVKMETFEAIAECTDRNNNAGKVESFEPPVDLSNDDINEADIETDEGKNHLKNVEEEVSTVFIPTDAEKMDNGVKANDIQEKVDSEDNVKDGTEEVKVVSKSARKRKNKRTRNRVAALLLAETAGASAGNNNSNEVEAEKVEEGSVDADADANDEQEISKGFIFMCNAKTKKDCFDYKIFGLPEGKKEMVTKIYKGMKLFLYDTDLKLLYGIYEAVTPGGYNIEPKAFKSKFPSQVRFTVVNDCLPLPEETFRNAIKENYFRRNKFSCLLSAEQVKNMCRLFKNSNKRTKVKRKAEDRRQEASGSAKRRANYVLGRGNTIHPIDHYGMRTFQNPPPSHQLVAVAPPLPAYGYRGAPVEMYSRDPYGYYREPVSYRDSLYTSGSSARYYAAGPPRYHY